MVSSSAKRRKNWFIDFETYIKFPKLLALSIPDTSFFMIVGSKNAGKTYPKNIKRLIVSATKKGTINVIKEDELWKKIVYLLSKDDRVFLPKTHYKNCHSHFGSLKTESWNAIKHICDEIGLTPNQALYSLEKSLSGKSLTDDFSLLDKIRNLTKQIQIFKENTENMNILLNRLIIIKDRDIQSLISTFKWSIFQYTTLQSKVIRYQLLKKLRFFNSFQMIFPGV